MAGLWQRTGNVTVTNGSKTITGFGTKWKTGTLPIQKGHTFYGPDNFAYEVDTVVSDESLTLVEAYRGGTLANQGYRIDITRTSTISQFAADLASLVAKYRAWFDGMMTWLTGSGDVAILNPDTGANVTIPSWKKVASEGEGQTARAKVEADRAKTEADRAFTEADRAAGIVAAAAIPLPDVWAPLSDSLRLLTGFGRDVLVGSDVVARMVNFSRNSTATYIGKDGQLKTAAANEPRFEKEGLLLEGQSTNIILHSTNMSVSPWSSGFSGSGKAPIITSNYGVAPDGSQSASRVVLDKGAGTEPANDSTVTCSLSTVAGATYTLSVWMKSTDGVATQKVSLSFNGAMATTVTVTGEWRRYSITAQATDSSRLPRLQLRGGVGTSDAADLLVWGWQQEVLAFASSYIPTNGAAVTRSADLATLPQLLNLGENQLGFSFGAEFDSVNTGGGRLLEMSDRSTVIVDGELMSIRHGGRGVFGISIPIGQRHHLAYSVAQDGSLTVALNGKVLSPQTTTAGSSSSTSVISLGNLSNGSGGRPLYGHLRDLKIWTKKPLSADQLKVASA
ncbi:phage head spike fiber domain-containing protein [Aeromonas caviae]|uniref:phage head spike fiber domain-containing protein n=1 Tax=Aeromonas caviae TaxID=648 RepID=UPI002B488140|nr:hypothetical protein [Aeromonas caviae]